MIVKRGSYKNVFTSSSRVTIYKSKVKSVRLGAFCLPKVLVYWLRQRLNFGLYDLVGELYRGWRLNDYSIFRAMFNRSPWECVILFWVLPNDGGRSANLPGGKVVLRMSILEVLTLLLVVFAALSYIDNKKWPLQTLRKFSGHHWRENARGLTVHR